VGVPGLPEGGALPPDFGEMLARVMAPGELEPAGEALEQALRLDDERLAAFLEMFAERVRASSEPVTSGELLSLVRAADRGAAAQSPPA
jgi:hypothetical protein